MNQAAEQKTEFKAYRARRSHGEALIDPPLQDAIDQLKRLNCQDAATDNPEILGQPLEQLRPPARRHLLQQASEYSDYLGARHQIDVTAPIVMGGHQPELFHPGVWFKNFALSNVAHRAGATAINLVVDQDICGARSIRVPRAFDGALHLDSIPLDRPGDAVPYEQSRINDLSVFNQFSNAVSDAATSIDHWRTSMDQTTKAVPSIQQLWPLVTARLDATDNLGLVIAQGRHQLEQQLGLQTLEVPISKLCDSEAFAVFVLHLIDRAESLQRAYNESLDVYRKAHRIRSAAHPVPSLRRQGRWFEMPLWMYDQNQPARRGVYARKTETSWILSDQAGTEVSVPASADPQEMVASFASRLGLAPESARRIKIRPRALAMTMFVRLFLCDLFLHGIGGGKYDQLSDLIMSRFFECVPLSPWVLSATYAPIGEHVPVVAPSSSMLRQQIRDTYFHPERIKNVMDSDDRLIKRKRELLEAIPQRPHKKAWHEEITQVNRQLANHLQSTRRDLQRDLTTALSREKQKRIASSREYAFCFYPLQPMASTLFELAQ